jgi:hypothetical protein
MAWKMGNATGVTRDPNSWRNMNKCMKGPLHFVTGIRVVWRSLVTWPGACPRCSLTHNIPDLPQGMFWNQQLATPGNTMGKHSNMPESCRETFSTRKFEVEKGSSENHPHVWPPKMVAPNPVVWLISLQYFPHIFPSLFPYVSIICLYIPTIFL